MHSLNKDEYIDKVTKHIRFVFDRDEIKTELKNHIEDKVDYYVEKGMSLEEAEAKSVEEMGDADSVGEMLNKEHNPIIGWLFYISNVLVVTLGIFVAFSVGVTVIYTGISYFKDLTKEIPQENIVYHQKIDEKVQIDDRVIGFTDVILDKDDSIYIYYYNYEKGLFGRGWSLASIGEITDNLGNKYFDGSGFSSGGIISKGYRRLDDFSKDADTLIITYDFYNRYYKVEIPLGEARSNE